jgi:hypothetical protein
MTDNVRKSYAHIKHKFEKCQMMGLHTPVRLIDLSRWGVHWGKRDCLVEQSAGTDGFGICVRDAEGE